MTVVPEVNGRRITHAGLTSDMFVLRASRFLVLKRTLDPGKGIEYLPGGVVDPGEDPEAAAIRETEEETGLRAHDVNLLRVWTYATPEGWETIHATFVGWSDEGDVLLTPEHDAFRWVTPDEYVAEWCREELEAVSPEHASWFRNVRKNCRLIEALR